MTDLTAMMKRLGFRPDGSVDLSFLGLPPDAIEARRRFLGGSDATIIARGDHSELEALRRFKRGGPAVTLDSLPVRLGLFTEPLNLAITEEKLSATISRRGERVYSAQRPFMACTLDGWLEPNKVVQAKHVNAFAKDYEVVQQYTPQLHHEMYVTGAEAALLVVIFGNHKHMIFEVGFDPLFAGQLVQAEEAFWKTVTDDVPAVPPTVLDIPVQYDAPVHIDLTGSNAFADAAARFLTHQEAAAAFSCAQTDLKALCPSHVAGVYGHGVRITRAKNGAKRISVMTEENDSGV